MVVGDGIWVCPGTNIVVISCPEELQLLSIGVLTDGKLVV
jgi:hypothetical protein